MNNVLTQLQIDLYSSTSYEVIKAQQGDKNSRVIEFILYSQGEPYEFSDNIFFRFVGHRGDGSSFSKTEEECITRNGNHVSVTLPEDVLYYDGIIEAKLVMYEPGDPTVKSAKSNLTDKLPEKPERTVLSSIPFKISCIKNPCNENDLSEGEVSIVTDLIFQMAEFSKNAQDVIDNAQNYATLAQSYAVGGTGERENEENDNAMHYYNQTKLLESSAKESKDAAKTSEINAAGSASSSNVSATTATQKANDASTYATLAQSYALGTGNARPDERTDNAKYYYEQARNISSSFRGALRPMGTVTFANLPELVNAGEGDMYNISDQFKTNENFKEGNGLIIPAGSNVYKTADGKWDILAGSPVTGVKGAAEPEKAYHTGNVNLTPEDIGTHSKSYINQNFIAGHVSHKRKVIAVHGWFRIAFLKTNGNGSSACTIKLSRTYNYGSPEYQEIKLFKAYNTYKFVAVNAFSLQNYWTQIRLVKCEDDKYYVDIYNSNPNEQGTGQNEWDVLVENDGMIYPWEAMEAKSVDSSDTGEIITSLNLPANLDVGNYLQNGKQIPVVGKTGYIAYPSDAYYQVESNSVTGYIGIVLPVSWTNTFLRFTVSIFNMGTGESCDYHISGYNYASTPTWSNCTAVCVGKAGSVHSNLPVRFGHNGTKCIICIGETSTKWIYPVVQVHDVVLGYNSRDFDTWKSGWDIHFYTGLPGTVNFLIPTTHVANGGVADSCTGNAATATKATQDGDGNNIVNTYAKKDEVAPYGVVTRGDFNNMTTPGVYTMNSVSANAPATGYFWGLIVLNSTEGSESYVEQIAIKEGTTNVYVRYRSGSWSSWTRLVKESDLSNYQKKTTTALSVTGTTTLSFSSTTFSNSSELYIYLIIYENSMSHCYNWVIDTETLKLRESLRLIDGYKAGNYEGYACVDITTTYAKIISARVANTDYSSSAILRVVFK